MTLHQEPPTRPITPAADAGWLDLRAAADVRARDDGAAELLAVLGDHLRFAGAGTHAAAGTDAVAGGGTTVRVIDLGAGTGANHRYLEPRLPFPQRWTAVDHDADLLVAAGHHGADPLVADVADLDGILAGLSAEGRLRSRTAPAGDLAEEPLLVTCSALLDVLTGDQLVALAEALLAHRCPALLSLSVTGAVTWSSPEPMDDTVAASFDAHQQRDGRLGPHAAVHLTQRLIDGGAQVLVRATPWVLGPDEEDLLRRWLDERVEAVLEQEPQLAAVVNDWQSRRHAQLDAGAVRVEVGHVDLLVLPAAGDPSGGLDLAGPLGRG